MIKLRNPYPRETCSTFVDFQYKIEQRNYLEIPEQQVSADFIDVFNRRRSKREFSFLPPEKLNALLWNSNRTIERIRGASERWEHRPSPSAGGRHPIDLFVISRGRDSIKLEVYEPSPHALATVCVDSQIVGDFYSYVNEMLPMGDGTLLWMGAQFGRTLSKYADGESLVWRDAGSLLATISFVAEALDLNSCAIGSDGSRFLRECLGTDEVAGVGGLAIGAKYR